MPRWQNLHRMVCRFPGIPGDTIIRPNMIDHQDGGTIKFYTVSDFRSRNINATPLRRDVVLRTIRLTGANSDITEHLKINGAMVTRTLSQLLP